MAKGLGLIGNFRGKLGNAVGYQLKDSNNKQTQGVRVYQPVVKNPKTAGQAEQRARMAVINATYRALKSVIDRGQEGVAYGNKSRLRWLSDAMKSFNGAWYEKGALIGQPALVPIAKGSLGGIPFTMGDGSINIPCSGVVSGADLSTFGKVSTALKEAYSALKDGDQITLVMCENVSGALTAHVFSFEIDTTDATENTLIVAGDNQLNFEPLYDGLVGAIIVSREGESGQHLRSNATLVVEAAASQLPPFDAASKQKAIASYMTAGTSVDWPVEK